MEMFALLFDISTLLSTLHKLRFNFEIENMIKCVNDKQYPFE